jgi:hypothetical protein
VPWITHHAVELHKRFLATYAVLSIPPQHAAQRIRLHYLRISYVAVTPHHLCMWLKKIFKDPFILLKSHSIVGYVHHIRMKYRDITTEDPT